jgi:hypothetical protein
MILIMAKNTYAKKKNQTLTLCKGMNISRDY